MAIYYVASKFSIIACSTQCMLLRRRRNNKFESNKSARNKSNGKSDEDDADGTNTDDWKHKELINMGFTSTVNTIMGTSRQISECQDGTDIEKDFERESKNEESGVVTIRYDGIIIDSSNGDIINGPLESLISLLIPSSITEIDNPHELLEKLIESVPKNDESLGKLVALMKEWTRWFPYDFRGEEIMSLVKHIASRCSENKQLGGIMSDLLSALLNKLTDLGNHENEMKYYKRPLSEPIVEWPNSSKLAQLLCHIEKKFAKHIGPEEFLQCSQSLIREEQQEASYDVPTSILLISENSAASTSLPSVDIPTANLVLQHDVQSKKKTCNLENYFEWSNRLRLLVANEILQCTHEHDRISKIELWSSVAQHCLLVGNYNSATSILEPICRLQMMWQKVLSTKNQQQIECLLKHIEYSQNLNLWNRQTEKLPNEHNKKQKQNSSSIQQQHLHIHQHRHHHHGSMESNSSNTKNQHKGPDWVVLPVFIDIVKLALKAREDCSTRLPNGCIDFSAFNKLSAIVSAFTLHMSNIPINSINCEEYNIVNHIFTCPLVSENELYLNLRPK